MLDRKNATMRQVAGDWNKSAEAKEGIEKHAVAR
jgi:hypothetical protein